jgi:DNA-directed RNA polymerases I, II, and III subunit RPABC2
MSGTEEEIIEDNPEVGSEEEEEEFDFDGEVQEREADFEEEEIDDDVGSIGESDHVTYEAYDASSALNNTTPYMTKYEYAKVLGLRCQMLSSGAPPTVKPEDFPSGVYPRNPKDIAKMEIKMKRLPFIINRPLPNGLTVKVSAADLIIQGHLLS